MYSVCKWRTVQIQVSAEVPIALHFGCVLCTYKRNKAKRLRLAWFGLSPTSTSLPGSQLPAMVAHLTKMTTLWWGKIDPPPALCEVASDWAFNANVVLNDKQRVSLECGGRMQHGFGIELWTTFLKPKGRTLRVATLNQEWLHQSKKMLEDAFCWCCIFGLAGNKISSGIHRGKRILTVLFCLHCNKSCNLKKFETLLQEGYSNTPFLASSIKQAATQAGGIVSKFAATLGGGDNFSKKKNVHC